MNKNNKKVSLITKKLNFSKVSFNFYDLVNFQRLLVNSMKLEIRLISEIRESFNPTRFLINIKSAYHKKQFFYFFTQVNSYLTYSFLYYFLFIWILLFPIKIFTNLKIWKITFFKLKLSIQEYRNWTRNSITTTWQQNINFRIGITFFPFVFGLSQMIVLRYQDQTFSLFIQKNLPAILVSPQKLSWQTYDYSTSKNLNLKNFFLTNSYLEKIKTDFSSEVKSSVSSFNLEDRSEHWFRHKEVFLNQFAHSVGFLKRIDFYSDSILLELTSKWQKQKNQIYFGTFPTSLGFDGNEFSSIPDSQTLNTKELVDGNAAFAPVKVDSKERDQSRKDAFTSSTDGLIGNNWYQISGRDIHSFFTNIKNSEIGFVGDSFQPINWIQKKMKKNYLSKTFFHLVFPEKYSSFFYDNLDELPLKLNQSYAKKTTSLLVKKLPLDSKKNILPLKNFQDQSELQKNKIVKQNSKKVFHLKYTPLKIKHLLDSLPLKMVMLTHEDKRLDKNNFNFNKVVLPQRDYKEELVSPFQQKRSLLAFSCQTNYVQPHSFSKTKASALNLSQDSYKTRNKVYKNYTFLQNELKKFFYKKGLNPINFFTFFESSLSGYSNESDELFLSSRPQNDNQDFNLADYCSEQILKKVELLRLDSTFNSEISDTKWVARKDFFFKNKMLIGEDSVSNKLQSEQEFRHKKEENFLIRPRVMSAYKFPDMKTSEIQSLILHFFYRNTLSNIFFLFKDTRRQELKTLFSPLLKIELPSSFLFHSKYDFPNFHPPKLDIQYRPTFFEDGTNTIYEGPGVVRNIFTKDLEITNKEYVENWLKKYLSPDNPMTDRPNSFFGKNVENLFAEKQKNSFDSNKDLTLLDDSKNEGSFCSEELLPALEQRGKRQEDSEKVRVKTGLQYFEKNSSLNQLYLNRVLNQEEKIQEKKSQEKLISPLNNEIKKTFFSYDNLPVVACDEELQVPYLTEQEWSVILEKIKREFKETALAKKLDFQENQNPPISVPLIRIRNPRKQAIDWPLTQIDYQPIKNFFIQQDFNLVRIYEKFDSNNSIKSKKAKGVNKNQFIKKPRNLVTVKYHYLPFSQILINSNLPHKKIFDSIYQKIFSIYKFSNFTDSTFHFPLTSFLPSIKQKPRVQKTKNFLDQRNINILSAQFRESWEPITNQSWLIITQVAFGFFVLHILKNFYKNYGRELVLYLVDLVASLGIVEEGLKEALELNDTEQGFRLIKKVPKKFQDIAGIDSILPDLGEIVWFLRNSGRSFKIGNIFPKGILLVGPPGTGKTLLVQAIAGEAEVPVLVQSGSSLNDPEQEGIGAQRLKTIFEEARKMAPCIVFIDEIDTFGERRENVIQNPMGSDELIESIQYDTTKMFENTETDSSNFIPKPKIETNSEYGDEQNTQKFSDQSQTSNSLFLMDEHSFSNTRSELKAVQQHLDKQEAKQEQLRLLMQFLIELDGLQSRKGVIVIGATNRPNVLDPALTRPGRFEKIINLELPGKQKRIEILKLYSQNLGIDLQKKSDPYVSDSNTILIPTEIGVPSTKPISYKMVGNQEDEKDLQILPQKENQKASINANFMKLAEKGQKIYLK